MPNLLWGPGLINMVCLSILLSIFMGGWGGGMNVHVQLKGGGVIAWGKDHNEYPN